MQRLPHPSVAHACGRIGLRSSLKSGFPFAQHGTNEKVECVGEDKLARAARGHGVRGQACEGVLMFFMSRSMVRRRPFSLRRRRCGGGFVGGLTRLAFGMREAAGSHCFESTRAMDMPMVAAFNTSSIV